MTANKALEVAQEAAERFIRHFFGTGGQKPQVQIPARPYEDDDLVLSEYFMQQRRAMPQPLEGNAAELPPTLDEAIEVVKQWDLTPYTKVLIEHAQRTRATLQPLEGQVKGGGQSGTPLGQAADAVACAGKIHKEAYDLIPVLSQGVEVGRRHQFSLNKAADIIQAHTASTMAQLEADNAKLREALEYYSRQYAYPNIEADDSLIARVALGKADMPEAVLTSNELSK